MSPIFLRIGKLLVAWKWVLGYTALLLLTLTQTRRFLDWLAEKNLSGLLGIFLFLTGTACLVLLLRRIHRVRGGLSLSIGLRLAGFIGLYLFCLLAVTNLTVDRIHFIQYGILGLLCFHAVDPGHVTGRRVGYAMVAVFAIGLLDESIQGLLDSRYFDLRDLVIDLLAGLLPVLGLLFLPLSPEVEEEGDEPLPFSVPKTEGSLRPSRTADVSAVILALFLLLGVLWVARVSWHLEPLYGEWVRENPCGVLERMQVERDGTIRWEDATGGNATGTYRIRGNRLDGPLLDVHVLEGQGPDRCSWQTGEGRHRYFRVRTERLVFTKEREFPFRRADPDLPSSVPPGY